MSENHSAHGRLDSWKEIADYLKRDVRTAMRWGKNNGMPVHRVPGGKRQAVFAFKEEIDAWMVSQKPQDSSSLLSSDLSDVVSSLPLEPNGETELEDATSRSAGDAEPDSGRRSWLIRVIRANRRMAVVIGASIVVGIITFSLARFRTAPAILPPSLHQLTDDRRAKLRLRTSGTTLYFNELEGSHYVLASMPVGGGPIRRIDTRFANALLQDVSSDGKTLLVSSFEGVGSDLPLWTIPIESGTPHRVGDALCDLARWSPDRRRIACAIGTRIILLDGGPDNSSSQIVGSFTNPVFQLLWAPDGRSLRFVLNDRSANLLSPWEVAISKDGSASPEHRLSIAGSCCGDWAWTADGQSFAYLTSTDGKTQRLMVRTGWPASDAELPVDIGGLIALSPGEKSNTLYLVMDTTTYRAELWQVDAKQGEIQPFLPGVSAEYVAYSRDGQWIVYMNTVDHSLWRSRTNGSEALQLTRPPVDVQVSSWSPDGQRIAFMGKAPRRHWRVFLIDRDGGAAAEAADGNDNQGGPSWSRDGKSIVYGNVECQETQSCWIRRLDIASRQIAVVSGSHGFRTARCSPDGKYIAALQPQTHELMLFDENTQHWRALADRINGDTVEWSNDSQSIYVDNPDGEKRVVERVWIHDKRRETVRDLGSLQKGLGTVGSWIGLTPDNLPIVSRGFTAMEVYKLDWTEH